MNKEIKYKEARKEMQLKITKSYGVLSKTRVVHCKKEKYDVMIDRRTIFGNPFPMKNKTDEERERVIKAYEKWFLKEIEENDDFRYSILARLVGKTLGCWCKPKACHGDVIVTWVEDFLKGMT